MCVQHRYSLIYRDMEREMFPIVREEGLGAMAFSPLATGLLSGLYSPEMDPPQGSHWASRPEEYRRNVAGDRGKAISTVIELAAELGKTPAQLALAWAISHPELTVAITGGDTVAHLDDNLGAVGWTLDPAVREKLDTVSASLFR